MSRQSQVQLQILEAAAHVIARRGYHGMSMRDLARATDKGLSTLYNYFPSKEEVLYAIQQRAFDALLESAEEVVGHAKTPSEALYELILNHVTYLIDHPDVMKVLVQEASALPDHRRDQIRARKARYFELARSIVQRGLTSFDSAPLVDTAEIERVTYCVFGMLNWIYGWYDADRHGEPADVADSIYRLATQGAFVWDRDAADQRRRG